ncbi:4Fe-4S binding protein [Desulfoglaeba alkanexedens]|nr:4Fe-4S binding protein [Desulfoglaeba alkanexedens]
MGRGPGAGRSVGPRGWPSGFGYRTQAPVTAAPQVDQEKCVGCGECAKACSFGAISIQNGKAVVAPQLCQGCRVCVSACPKGAIS